MGHDLVQTTLILVKAQMLRAIHCPANVECREPLLGNFDIFVTYEKMFHLITNIFDPA